MKITFEVNNCHECMYSISNMSLHDDPFTSAPLPSYYVCQSKGGPSFIGWDEARKGVHSQCPHK
jgi:hypothetical protein